MKEEFFGALPDGRYIYRYTLSSPDITLSVISFGAAIQSLSAFGVEIVGGFPDVSGYLSDDSHQGGTIGRVANRIGGAEFQMDGRVFRLTKNDGDNCLHGGSGFDRRVWRLTDSGEDFVTLGYTSPDGEEGFPGELEVKVTFRLDKRAVVISYEARPTEKTPISLTNHAYFNLDGFGSDILGHRIQIFADRYTEVDEALIPTGERPSVKGTPMDLGSPTTIGEVIDEVGGFDHSYFLSGELMTDRFGTPTALAAVADNGRLALEVYTDRPCLQFYSGNFLGQGPNINGVPQVRQGSFCLEAQIEPNSVKRGEGIFRRGEVYRQTTVYNIRKI